MTTSNNEYKPWESLGISEADYWKKEYLTLRQNESKKDLKFKLMMKLSAFQSLQLSGIYAKISNETNGLKDVVNVMEELKTSIAEDKQKLYDMML